MGGGWEAKAKKERGELLPRMSKASGVVDSNVRVTLRVEMGESKAGRKVHWYREIFTSAKRRKGCNDGVRT